MKRKIYKVLSLLLSVALFLNMGLTPAFAEEAGTTVIDTSETTEDSTLCEDHKIHDIECGYIEAKEAQPCDHLKEDGSYSCTPIKEEINTTNLDDESAVYGCEHSDDCHFAEAVVGKECRHTCQQSNKDEVVEKKCACEPVVTDLLVNHSEGCPLFSAPKISEAMKALIGMLDALPNAIEVTKENMEVTLHAFDTARLAYDELSVDDKPLFEGTAQYIKMMELSGVLYSTVLMTSELRHDMGIGDLIINDTCDDSCGGHIVTGTSTGGKILVEGGTHNITLDNVNIDVSGTSDVSAFEIKGKSSVNLTLIGANILKSGLKKAGLQVPEDNTLIITSESTGSLESTGGPDGSGIGGGAGESAGNITISGGSITATGSAKGSGIGGGAGESGGIITINGGSITATGDHEGSGIGGGSYGSGGIITISGGTVTATGGFNGSGIGGGNWSSGGTITISGGTVTANGGSDGSGIGGGNWSSGGTITISSGTVTATGRENGSGIGGGANGSGGIITIKGGTITATSNMAGSAIGGGYHGSGGIITIDGGNITATGFYGSGIGDGGGGTGGTFATHAAGQAPGNAFIITSSISDNKDKNKWSGVIFDDKEFMNEGKVYGHPTLTTNSEIPMGKTLIIESGNSLTIGSDVIFTNSGNIDNKGNFINKGVFKNYGAINGAVVGDGATFEQRGDFLVNGTLNDDYTYKDNKLTFIQNGTYDISMKNGISQTNLDRIVVTNGVTANITLNDVNIDVSGTSDVSAFEIEGKSSVNLTLIGANILKSGLKKAGLQVPEDNTLTITSESTGSLESTGGSNGSGIGGGAVESAGNITISGGTITAIGIAGGSGIGGGFFENGGTITISGGTITATGGSNASGIGGGEAGSGGTITISSGDIIATGGKNSSGIGGGRGSSGGIITISGGNITTNGNTGGSGIGGGLIGSGGIITINGGTITANGGNSASGIGGGELGSGGIITISGGTITATGDNGNFASGIGDGRYGTGGTFATHAEGQAPGNAFIIASSISDNKDKTKWSGVIFDDNEFPNEGKVYGHPTLTTNSEIPMGKTLIIESGKSLTIANGVTLTNEGKIKNYGTLSGDVRGNGSIDTHRISLSPAGTYTFLRATKGYGEQNPLPVTVQNTGNQVTGALTVALSGANSGSFTLSKGAMNSIAVKGTDNFTIVPNIGLAAGTYTATVTVSGSDGISTNFNVSFTVKSITPPDDNKGNDEGRSETKSTTPTKTTKRTTQENSNPSAKVQTDVNSKTDEKGKAIATVSDQSVTDAMKRAQTEAKKNGLRVVLNVKTDKNATSLEIILSKATMNALIQAKVTELSIDNAISSVAFDLATLKSLTGGEVKLTISKVDTKTLSTEVQQVLANRSVFQYGVTVGGQSVTDFNGGRVGLQMPYAHTTTEQEGDLWAVYVNEDGEVTWLENSSYDPITGMMLVSTSHFSIYGVGYKQSTSKFTDVETHWAKNDIDFIVARGLISGTSNTTFGPDQNMTRGMFVTALGKLAGIDTKKYNSTQFTDVKEEDDYAPYIAWAYENHIVNGTTNTTFSPDKAISRQEMAVILVKTSKVIDYKLPSVHAEIRFADTSSIGTWAKSAVKQMQMAGVLTGKSDNKFDPVANATRAEVSAMLRRFVKLMVNTSTAEGWIMNESGQWMYIMNGKRTTGKKTVEGKSYEFDPYGVASDVKVSDLYHTGLYVYTDRIQWKKSSRPYPRVKRMAPQV